MEAGFAVSEQKRKNKIIYMTFARLPSKSAHAVNIVKMCQSIAKLGYEIVLMADVREDVEEVFSFYEITTKYEIIRNRVSSVRVIGRLIAVARAFFIVLKIRPDIIFVRDVFNGILATFLAMILKTEVVFEAHELFESGVRRVLLKKILFSGEVQKLVFISHRLLMLIQEKFGEVCRDKKCIVAHDGVDLGAFQGQKEGAAVRRYLKLQGKAFVVGYTGSVFPGRGVNEVILKIAQDLRDVFFVIVGGEGAYFETLKNRVKELNLRNVDLAGFVPHQRIPAFLDCFDVLMMPYQVKVLHRQKGHDTSEYMSPLKMFEYMASGKPIIASRLPVIEEVLKDGENAILVDPDNVEGWARAVLSLKENRKLAEKIGKKARKDVVTYSWDKRAEKVFENHFTTLKNS